MIVTWNPLHRPVEDQYKSGGSPALVYMETTWEPYDRYGPVDPLLWCRRALMNALGELESNSVPYKYGSSGRSPGGPPCGIRLIVMAPRVPTASLPRLLV